MLTNKNSKTVNADPRCFFLPFFINQDGSWQTSWETFVSLQQYRAPVGAILEYFSGIKPPEYYEVSSRRLQAEHMLDDLRKEQRFLEKARERFGKSMSLSGPKLEPENFENEMNQLAAEVTELNRRQEILRDVAVRDQEVFAAIQLQIHLAADALKTYDNDTAYLRTNSSQNLICPTCGAEHVDSFLELLTYSEDARILRELVARLSTDARKAGEQYRKTQLELRDLETNYRRVSEILDTRRGNLKFRQVVDSIGAESAFKAFEEEGAALKQDINLRLGEIEDFKSRMKELTSPARSKEIINTFRLAYTDALNSLNLPPMNTSKLKLTSRPNESGSGGPRSILAYYGALWKTCIGNHASFSVPLVIDSPNQQGQDDINLPKVIAFIATGLPVGTQVIVGTEMETDHLFDKRIFVDKPYSLLETSAYVAVGDLVEPLVKAMHKALMEY